jgi:hypothetical protein
MLRGILTMAAAALAMVALSSGARAGGCAGCGTVLASPQASEQVWAAPQVACAPAPTVYCEEPKGCCLGDKLKGFGHGLGCKLGGMKEGLCCKVDGLKCKMSGLGCGIKDKFSGLGCGLKDKFSCHKATPVYETCAPVATYPCEQTAYPAPQGVVAPAPQYAAPQYASGQ